MSRRSRISVWDWTHDVLQHITHLGWNVEHTPAQGDLIASLQRLYDMPLPLEAIAELADLVTAAYNAGVDRGAAK